jgi:ribose transport system permease protein
MKDEPFVSLDLPSSLNRKDTTLNAINTLATFLLRYGAFLAIVIVVVYFAIRSPVFLKPFNILNVLRQVAVLATASFGMAAVVMGGGTHVIAGGIDLSIGANIGLATAVSALLLRSGQTVGLALGASLLVALTVALLNATVVVYLGLLPLLATLAMMYTANGIELLLTQNTIVSADSQFTQTITDGNLLGIPMPVIILLAMFLLYYVLLHWTPVGMHIQAVGGSREAAQTSGLQVRFYIILSYLLAGFAAAVSSLLVLARLSGSTPGIGGLILLDIVLATYVSATFSRRWTINIPGVLIGAFFVGILTNGFTLINVPTYWVHGIKGILVLFVVSATALQQKVKTA